MNKMHALPSASAQSPIHDEAAMTREQVWTREKQITTDPCWCRQAAQSRSWGSPPVHSSPRSGSSCIDVSITKRFVSDVANGEGAVTEN